MSQTQKLAILGTYALLSIFASVIFWTNTLENYLESSNDSWVMFDAELEQNLSSFLHAAAFKYDLTKDKDNFIDEIFEPELDKWSIKHKYNLLIPSQNIDVPVHMPSMKYWSKRQWNLLEKQMQIGLLYGSVAYPHSSVPGENGTLIVAGHSSPPNERAKESEFASVFEELPNLGIGNHIIVTQNGKEYLYKVTNTKVVPPSDTSILQQQEEEDIITLITCFPVGTTRDRLVVTAKLSKITEP